MTLQFHAKKRNGSKFIKYEIEKNFRTETRDVYDSFKPKYLTEKQKEKKIRTDRNWRQIPLLLENESPRGVISAFGQK